MSQHEFKSHDIPFFYKGLGRIQRDTLDNPLMDNYPVLLKHFTGPSLDMFAHRKVRTSVSNQFEPERDFPQPRPPERDKHVRVLHEPVQQGRGVLESLKDDRFDVILIDPPYTPLQQKALYGSMKTRAQELLVDSHQGIEELYHLSWGYATEHADAAIVVYGYKLAEASSSWRRAAAWAIGGGSHPAIVAHLFLHRSVAASQEAALLRDLEHHALQRNAEVTRITIIEHADFEPVDYHVGTPVVGTDVWLFAKADEFKRRRIVSDPTVHPGYLSRAMMTLAKERVPPRIHTVLGALYRTCTINNRKMTCFSPGVQRFLYAPHTWSDSRFVLQK